MALLGPVTALALYSLGKPEWGEAVRANYGWVQSMEMFLMFAGVVGNFITTDKGYAKLNELMDVDSQDVRVVANRFKLKT